MTIRFCFVKRRFPFPSHYEKIDGVTEVVCPLCEDSYFLTVVSEDRIRVGSLLVLEFAKFAVKKFQDIIGRYVGDGHPREVIPYNHEY